MGKRAQSRAVGEKLQLVLVSGSPWAVLLFTPNTITESSDTGTHPLLKMQGYWCYRTEQHELLFLITEESRWTLAAQAEVFGHGS